MAENITHMFAQLFKAQKLSGIYILDTPEDVNAYVGEGIDVIFRVGEWWRGTGASAYRGGRGSRNGPAAEARILALKHNIIRVQYIRVIGEFERKVEEAVQIWIRKPRWNFDQAQWCFPPHLSEGEIRARIRADFKIRKAWRDINHERRI